MSNIEVLPGVERNDLIEDAPSPDVLVAAIESGLTDVIVIGRDRAGEFYLASASGDTDHVVGMLMRAVARLADTTTVVEEDTA